MHDPTTRVSTPLGLLALRHETAADEPFRRALFERSWMPGALQDAMPPALRTQLAPMQFAAQSAGYAAAYPKAESLILEIDGAAVGRLMVDRSAACVRVVDVAVAPERRGQGVGSAVLRALTEEARRAGLPVRLSVLAGNRAARLYERLGFQPIGVGDAHAEYEWRPEVT